MTLPLYAKECASEAGYSLACSCLGFPRITRAAAQPVTTKTVTVIRTVGNVTLPPFFANTTRLAGNGTGTVGSTIHTGKSSGRTNSTRPTTLFTSRVSSSKGVSSGWGLSSVSRTTTLSSSKAIFKGTSNGSGSISVSSLSSSSTTKSTVHVVNIATLTTTKEPLWVNTTSTRSHLAGNTTLAPYTDSTAVLATAFENITTSSRLNATTSVNYSILLNTTASWYKGTSTSSILAGTGTGVISTTASVKLPIPQNTTASWYNGTSTSIQPLGTGTGIILTTGMGRPITTTSARIPYPQNPTAPWSNGTSTTFPPLGTGTAIILTTGTGVILTTAPFTYLTTTTTVITSARFPFPLNTTAFWSNGTATTSSTILGTGTGIGTGIIITGTGYYKSTPTTTTSAKPTATATEDLTCGETTTPFALRVTQPGGTFDKWFVHVVGNGLLFTSSQSQGSAFSVEGTGHLCAVGYGDSNGKPRIAAVGVAGAGAGTEEDETHTESGEAGEGPVWMLRQGTLKAYWEDYKALECTRDGGGLSCAPAANGTSAGAVAGADGGGGWVGCGLMLSLGRDVDVGYGGLNCSSIALEVVES
ncbi:hypothetical protein SMACR_02017 [Sordaria macrospora]|nr:hypothetical protein SMACR_02017 [Sordaria macrospora]